MVGMCRWKGRVTWDIVGEVGRGGVSLGPVSLGKELEFKYNEKSVKWVKQESDMSQFTFFFKKLLSLEVEHG